MMYQIEYAYTCHMGRIRANNEDNFWCCGEMLPSDNSGIEGIHTGISPTGKLPVFAVFDGMGGESCGEMAAFLAADQFGRYYNENKRILKIMPDSFIESACRSMNEAVCRYGRENKIQSMGTTAAMIFFAQDEVYVCNLGDSRIYMYDSEQFTQISTDHVLGGNIYGKAPLTQYLGIPEDQQFPDPCITELEYKEKTRFLLCSDGMTDMLSDGEIADILSREIPLKDTVELLLDRSLKKGGRDNITIILCQVQRTEHRGKIKTWLKNIKERSEV